MFFYRKKALSHVLELPQPQHVHLVLLRGWSVSELELNRHQLTKFGMLVYEFQVDGLTDLSLKTQFIKKKPPKNLKKTRIGY